MSISAGFEHCATLGGQNRPATYFIFEYCFKYFIVYLLARAISSFDNFKRLLLLIESELEDNITIKENSIKILKV